MEWIKTSQNSKISTHTLRGERDVYWRIVPPIQKEISTHTLRGERDKHQRKQQKQRQKFQLTRSVGSVTQLEKTKTVRKTISTHTLRGERDTMMKITK